MAVSWRSVLNIFTYVAEVAALVIIEGATAGGATPLVAVGIGLVGASSRLGIDYSRVDKDGMHKINALGTGIDFAGALLPGLGAIKDARLGARLLINAEKEVSTNLTKSSSLLFKGMDRSAIRKASTEAAKKNLMGINRKSASTLVHDLENQSKYLLSSSKRFGERAGMFESIKNEINLGFGTTRKSMQNQIKKITGLEEDEAIRLFKTLTKSNKKINPINFDMNVEELSEMLHKALSPEKSEQLLKILESTQYMRSNDLTFVAQAFSKSLSPAEAQAMAAIKLDTETLVLNSAGKLTTSQRTGSSFAEKVRYLGSKRFNDKIIQNIQLIDPNDLGRAPVEFVYRKLKKSLDDKILRKESREIANKGIKGLIKAEGKMESAFVKSGGTLIPTNRYLLGYKVIPGAEMGGEHLVMFVFNKISTSSISKDPRYINSQGKHDVFVRMTKKDMMRLSEEGVSYYWDMGKKKGWYRNKGGRRVKGSLSHTVSPELSLFLGVVPIPALRLIESGVSNVVENVSAIAQGTYFKTYIQHLERAFTRSAINRSARLMTRTVIGGVALKKTGQKWIGRELQRAASLNLSFFEGQTKSGYFTFRGMTTAKRGASRSESYINRVILGSMTAGKSGMLRKARRQGNTLATNHISSTRNMKITGRIPSAVTPNRVGGKSFYNTKSIFTFKF